MRPPPSSAPGEILQDGFLCRFLCDRIQGWGTFIQKEYWRLPHHHAFVQENYRPEKNQAKQQNTFSGQETVTGLASLAFFMLRTKLTLQMWQRKRNTGEKKNTSLQLCHVRGSTIASVQNWCWSRHVRYMCRCHPWNWGDWIGVGPLNQAAWPQQQWLLRLSLVVRLLSDFNPCEKDLLDRTKIQTCHTVKGWQVGRIYTFWYILSILMSYEYLLMTSHR